MDDVDLEFPPTPWSLIHRIQEGSEEDRALALETICASYWQPLYVYARILGHSPADAEDLAQDFFAQVALSGLWERAEQDRGRLRSLLIGSFKRVVADQGRRRGAGKRGGTTPHVSLDREVGEQSYELEKRPGLSPDAAYDHVWALAVFLRALGEVEEEYNLSGKAGLFSGLRPLLMKTDEASCGEVAARLNTSEGAIKSSLHKLRARCREHFRHLVKQTLIDSGELDEEVSYLLAIIKERGGL